MAKTAKKTAAKTTTQAKATTNVKAEPKKEVKAKEPVKGTAIEPTNYIAKEGVKVNDLGYPLGIRCEGQEKIAYMQERANLLQMGMAGKKWKVGDVECGGYSDKESFLYKKASQAFNATLTELRKLGREQGIVPAQDLA